MRIRQSIIWLLLAFFALPVAAQVRGNEISVVVSPDHTDWTYGLKEKARFRVQVYKAQNLLPGAVIDYELGPEMYPSEKKSAVTLPKGETTLTASMSQPGFLRCKVWAHVDGRTYEGLATAAYAPEQLQPTSQLPSDFMDYWQQTLTEARKVPLDLRMKPLPDRCTSTDKVYEVSFNTKAGGHRFYGILSIPKAEGRYPAILRVPGAGIRPYTGDTYTAPGRCITLEVGIHGIPVTLEQSTYDALWGALDNYWTFRRESRDAMYYHRVIVGALRAVDVICSLPQYNGQALAVTGSSQGGALSIITAALDARVTCLAAVHPALCDHEAYFAKRACGWPHYYKTYGEPTPAERETLRYYDTAHFARFVKQTGWYSWGYNDEVCPPTSIYAAYNVIPGPKELQLYLQTGHYWYQEQWDTWQEWVRRQLGL